MLLYDVIEEGDSDLLVDARGALLEGTVCDFCTGVATDYWGGQLQTSAAQSGQVFTAF